jgi:hypothetical protein
MTEPEGRRPLYEDINLSDDESAVEDAAEPALVDPGWYTYFGGMRFYDGEDWVGEARPPVQRINYWLLAAAVAAGVTVGGVLAWFLVWLGAQASPEHIYLPVKFVVKELPKAFQ